MRRLGERRRSRAKEMRAARAPASAVEVNNMGGNPWCDLCGEAGGRVGGGRWWACWPGGMDPCAYATAACALMCAPACAPRYSVRYVFCVSGAWRRVWGDRALLEAASPAGLGFSAPFTLLPSQECVRRPSSPTSGVIRGLLTVIPVSRFRLPRGARYLITSRAGRVGGASVTFLTGRAVLPLAPSCRAHCKIPRIDF